MKLKIYQQNIVKMKVDALVNSANPQPWHGSGTDHSIYDAAGPELLEARKKIGILAPGTAAITKGYNLDAKYVIHAVARMWEDGQHGEPETLRNCYENALKLASEYHCKSIAFPLLGTGYYKYPIKEGLQIALSVCQNYALTHHDQELTIYLVVFHPEGVKLARSIFNDIKPCVTTGEKYRIYEEEYEPWYERRPDLKNPYCSNAVVDIDSNAAVSFTEQLEQMKMASGKSKVDIYKGCQMLPGTFNNYLTGKRKPSKDQVFKIAIGLELGYDDAELLLSKAGYEFTDAPKDQIVKSYLEKGIWDPMKIDEALYEQTGDVLCSMK